MKVHSSLVIRYAIVGVANTLLYGLAIWLFLHLNLFPLPVSSTIAFLFSMIFQYLSNRAFTFRSRNPMASEVKKYLVTSVITYVLSSSLIWLFVDRLNAPPSLTAAAVAGITATTGFLLSHFWVFRQC